MGQGEPRGIGSGTEVGAICNVGALLADEHVQEREEELKENNTKWDVIGLGEVRRKEESFTTLQSGHLLYHTEANNVQADVVFIIVVY